MLRTLRATNKKILERKGFSLIEILIVIALLALITAVGIPAFNNAFRTSKESFARKMALLLREARDRAMLTNKLLRLRIDFDKQEYWLEEAPSTYLRQKAPERGVSEREKEALAEKEKNAFRMVTELTKEKVAMPNGLKIVEIKTPRSRESITEGLSDIYFYNNGSADGATIYFEDEEENVRQRIILHPITGHSKHEMGAGEETR